METRPNRELLPIDREVGNRVAQHVMLTIRAADPRVSSSARTMSSDRSSTSEESSASVAAASDVASMFTVAVADALDALRGMLLGSLCFCPPVDHSAHRRCAASNRCTRTHKPDNTCESMSRCSTCGTRGRTLLAPLRDTRHKTRHDNIISGTKRK